MRSRSRCSPGAAEPIALVSNSNGSRPTLVRMRLRPAAGRASHWADCGPTRLSVLALHVVRVVNRPSDPLDQPSGVMTTSQICGRDPLVKGDRAFRLCVRLAHHDDSRHNKLPSGGWTPGDHREADRGVDGDVRLLINLADRVRRYRSMRFMEARLGSRTATAPPAAPDAPPLEPHVDSLGSLAAPIKTLSRSPTSRPSTSG